jgi:1-phosphatidylinositol phosphodiesterase
MFSRFGSGDGWENGREGLGMHPTNWPDSARLGFSWRCKNTLVRTHDWYKIPSFLSIPEKVALSTHILLPPDGPPTPTLSITFFSASSVPLALPPTVARGFGWPELGLGIEGVNKRVGRWLLETLGNGFDDNDSEKQTAEREPRLRGWVLMDFYADPENAIVPLLVECNFKGTTGGGVGSSGSHPSSRIEPLRLPGRTMKIGIIMLQHTA